MAFSFINIIPARVVVQMRRILFYCHQVQRYRLPMRSLRSGSIIAPARCCDWGFVSGKFIDVTNFEVDIALYFDSQEHKGIVCPNMM